MNKIKELRDWLDANPDKTKRDWLLEVRCKNGQQREDLKKLFAWIDEVNSNPDERKHMDFEICPYPLRVTDHHTMPEGYPSIIDDIGYGEPKEDVEIFFDFSVGRFFYDLETPEEIYSIPSSPNYNAPYFKTRKYYEWKADQLGLRNTNFVIRAIECGKHGSGIHDFPPHWKTLPNLYPNK